MSIKNWFFFFAKYIRQSIFIENRFFKIVLSPEQLALVIPRHCKNFGFSFNHYIIFQRHLLIYYLSVLILNLLFLLSLHMYFAPTIHCIVCTFFSLSCTFFSLDREDSPELYDTSRKQRFVHFSSIGDGLLFSVTFQFLLQYL